MEQATVSIIVSIYNAERYLVECLESILAQTLKNTEIICVDDASTDATPQILRKYQDKVTILTNNENCMAGESRNRGFEISSGEYVIFLDADDLFEPDMLEKAYHKAKISQADVCIFKENLFADNIEVCKEYSYAEILMNDLGKRRFFTPLEFSDVLFSLWNGWAWDKLFRREFIEAAGLRFPRLQTSEDGFFVHAAMASANKISFINEVLIHHRVGNDNSLSNMRNSAWESCLIYLKELKKYLIQRKLYDIYKRSYINWSLDFLYWNYQTLNVSSRKQLAAAMRDFFINDLVIGQYSKNFFYNSFSKWFADRIVMKETDGIPVTEEEHFLYTYRLNLIKIKSLVKYMSKYQWKTALWGAGIRGQAFIKACGKDIFSLYAVYDSDTAKQGRKLQSGLVIKGFEQKQEESVDCILVLNSSHLLSVRKLLGKENILLFDMNTYLNFSWGVEACFM